MPFDQVIFAEVRAAVKRDMYNSQVTVNVELKQNLQDIRAQQLQSPETNSQRTNPQVRARAPATV